MQERQRFPVVFWLTVSVFVPLLALSLYRSISWTSIPFLSNVSNFGQRPIWLAGLLVLGTVLVHLCWLKWHSHASPQTRSKYTLAFLMGVIGLSITPWLNVLDFGAYVSACSLAMLLVLVVATKGQSGTSQPIPDYLRWWRDTLWALGIVLLMDWVTLWLTGAS